jgi:hypothetical protein
MPGLRMLGSLHIDRATFLTCVAALSAVACTPKADRRASEARTVDIDITTSGAETAKIEIRHDAGTACDEHVDGTPSCDLLKPPGPACEDFAATVASCKRAKKILRPASADRVVRCLLARNGTQELCSLFRRGSPVAFCFEETMRLSCIDRAADAECTKLLARFPKEELFGDGSEQHLNCRSAVAAMRDPAPMLECLKEPMSFGGSFEYRPNAAGCYERLDVP